MVELSARAEGRIYRIFLAKLGKVSQAHVSIIEPSCDTNTHYPYYHNIKQNVNQINKNEHINRKRLMP